MQGRLEDWVGREGWYSEAGKDGGCGRVRGVEGELGGQEGGGASRPHLGGGLGGCESKGEDPTKWPTERSANQPTPRAESVAQLSKDWQHELVLF